MKILLALVVLVVTLVSLLAVADATEKRRYL